MRIIFHLGTYKTGSSSFQNLLFHNRKVLLENGIIYPKTGLTRDESTGVRHRTLINNYMQGKLAACPKSLIEEIERSSAETVVLSTEAWSNPSHLSHLTRIVTVLKDKGHECSGVVSLRNLSRYQVSHYREFTVKRSNHRNYKDYIRMPAGMFDYLFLCRSFRSIFGQLFAAVPFEGSLDITGDLLEQIGLGHMSASLEPLERSNVRSLGALEVEAIRIANKLKKPKPVGLAVLSEIMSSNSDIAVDDWTERFVGDVPIFTRIYRKELMNVLEWMESDVDTLYEQTLPKERNVSDLRKDLTHKIKHLS